jgi:hypothetical protein
MRSVLFALAVAFALVGCGGKKGGGGGGDDDPFTPDACVGLECQIVDCVTKGQQPTTLKGTVFAPNGTLPLNGVNVYVPRDPLPAFTEGVSCDRCSQSLPGSPVVQTISDAQGNFVLQNVPVGENIPLVITTGKWRRTVTIDAVSECSEATVAADDTRLPKNKAEGDIPRIAITTGNADTMECLARKLGIADSEISPSTGTGRVHLYAGNGTKTLKAGFPGGSGATLTGAEGFWSSLDTLKAYDIVILSCEGSQLTGNPVATPKSQTALDVMKQYADLGGRIFASHWHNIWIGGRFQGGQTTPTQTSWANIASWTASDGDPGETITIDEIANPKGPAFAEWMLHVMGSTTRDQIVLSREGNGDLTGRRTATELDTALAERWVKAPTLNDAPQMFQFTTPTEISVDQRCGKVVFTDMHVSGQSPNPTNAYPTNCLGGENNLTLTPQEKALAFMFFDIAGCVGGIF